MVVVCGGGGGGAGVAVVLYVYDKYCICYEYCVINIFILESSNSSIS